MAQRFRSPTPGDTLSEAKPTFTREFPGEAGGPRTAPWASSALSFSAKPATAGPLCTAGASTAPRRDRGLCDHRQGPAPLWASC